MVNAAFILKYFNYLTKWTNVYFNNKQNMIKIPAHTYLAYKYKEFRRKTNQKIVVDTIHGPVKGVKRLTCWKIPFYSFEKVPFAKPPIKELRFKEPETPIPWKIPLDCTNEAPMALQIHPFTDRFVGSEDCLYLSVFTKNVNPHILQPVMIWIHGGDFLTGGTSREMYSPDYFMQEDIVLVLIAYRLGPFGFLSLKDPHLEIPGNAGLKDQVLALKWVSKNIYNFGGDPHNITLFGADSGAASTHYMSLTNQTKDMFHKAILMSGSVFSPFALVSDRDYSYRLAKKIGYGGKRNEGKILKFLTNVGAEHILRANKNIVSPEEEREYIFSLAGPVIEPFVMDSCVIPKEPRLMAREAWSNHIPFMAGGTSSEGLYCYPRLKKNIQMLDGLSDCRYMVPSDLEMDRHGDLCIECGMRLKQEHLKKEKPTVESFLELMSYKLFWHSLHRALLSRGKYASGPTYIYRFDAFVPGLNFYQEVVCKNEVSGVAHCDDLSYLFLNMFLPELNSMRGYDLVYKMIRMRTNFAATGNPNCDGLRPVRWEPLQGNPPFKCLNISDDVEFIDLPESRTLEVWDSLYPNESLC